MKTSWAGSATLENQTRFDIGSKKNLGEKSFGSKKNKKEEKFGLKRVQTNIGIKKFKFQQKS